MQILISLLIVIGGIAFWLHRVRSAREQAGDIADAVDDVRLAARRIMHNQQRNVHPADAVDDPRLAAAGIVVAVATMDQPISQTEIEALKTAAQETFDVSEREALDIVSFGRWVSDQCGTNDEAVRRLSKVVAKLAGSEAEADLLRMIEVVAASDGVSLGEDEQDAMSTVRRAFRAA